MSTTPNPTHTLEVTCVDHGKVRLPPSAVTLNAALDEPTYQFMCPGDGHIGPVTKWPCREGIALLHTAHIPYVPRGIDAELAAECLGRDVFSPDRVPSWEAAEAEFRGLA